MKFIDLFAGIGGFRLGMESAGHECVAFCEIDKFARASYKAIHDTEGEEEFHDITSVTDEQWRKYRGTVDVICGGFPCQAFSIAGKRKGFLDETRGTLFFEIAMAIKQIKPRLLFLENVKGLLSHDKGRTFGIILNTLDELGYDCEWQVLNSKNFGVPQNRERVFIIGHLRGECGREVFPITGNDTTLDNQRKIIVSGMLEKSGKYSSDTNRRVYNTYGISPTLPTMQGGGQEPKIITGQPTRIDGKRQVNYKLSNTVGTLLASQYKNGDTQPKVVIPVLTPDRAKKRQNGRRFKENGEEMFTLTAQDRHGVLIEQLDEITKKSRPNEKIEYTFKENGDIRPHRMDTRKSGISELNINHEENPSHTVTTSHAPKVYGESTEYRIRKLTPRECWRLQGFHDYAFDKAQEVNSNSQLYKQAGNSVTVNVIIEIAKRLE